MDNVDSKNDIELIQNELLNELQNNIKEIIIISRKAHLIINQALKEIYPVINIYKKVIDNLNNVVIPDPETSNELIKNSKDNTLKYKIKCHFEKIQEYECTTKNTISSLLTDIKSVISLMNLVHLRIDPNSWFFSDTRKYISEFLIETPNIVNLADTILSKKMHLMRNKLILLNYHLIM
jgi:hypothetical protein